MITGGISIKGIGNGLKVTLEDGLLTDQFQVLDDQLANQGAFFQGAQVTLVVGNQQLDTPSLEEAIEFFSQRGMDLQTVLAEHPDTLSAAQKLKLGTRLAGSGRELAGGQTRPDMGTQPIHNSQSEPANGLLIRGAVRSGQVISTEGHVTVIGDVNPGAEIIAGGEVVVWGRLRGLVHAGAYGDRNALVCALDLAP
ncbi:MAG: septum site-determining protein MinC, partial [Anaerolineales bacterium]|nr:septum site-determining protein MinC [Anaerolineales bacterium]